MINRRYRSWKAQTHRSSRAEDGEGARLRSWRLTGY